MSDLRTAYADTFGGQRPEPRRNLTQNEYLRLVRKLDDGDVLEPKEAGVLDRLLRGGDLDTAETEVVTAHLARVDAHRQYMAPTCRESDRPEAVLIGLPRRSSG